MERSAEAKAFVPRPPEAGGGGQAPMKVDAVGQVDAIGFDKPRCNLCKKLGHAAEFVLVQGQGWRQGRLQGWQGRWRQGRIEGRTRWQRAV
eukprot:4556345-Pyramimonas_sp.AAC.1